MMECQRDGNNSDCWKVPGLPDKFNTPVNEFSRDVLGVDVGPSIGRSENQKNQ